MSYTMEYILKMQFSKNKSSCGYAKLAKPKSSPSPPDPHPHHHSQPLLEELMSELQTEDSQYIQKLLNKQEARGKPTQFLPSSPKHAASPQPTQICSPRPSTKAEKNPCNLSSSQSESSLPHPPERSYFLSRIDDYLCALGHAQKPYKPQKRQVPMQREYRRTHDVPDRTAKQQINSTRYELLLNKLQQSLLSNDALEEVIEEKDERIGELKGVVKSMWGEIQGLQRELEVEREERLRMSAALEDLAGRIQSVRSSKEKDRGHYIPTHQKRNSHVPRSDSRNREEFFNRSDLDSILQQRSNQMARREREESSQLRKKGKTHKYKLSDCFQEQLPATIYDNSFQ